MSYPLPLESPPTSPIAETDGLSTNPVNVQTQTDELNPLEPLEDKLLIPIPADFELLLRNLRLLDLHLLPDWPNITSQTFRPEKDARVKQKARVGKAEWILYRLAELWDETGTHQKLGHFFPAHEPIQSIKLRSGLFQLLNTLKQDGVLGQGCPLRKSMLDECKGEKFEEVLLLFSTVVLRKVVADRKDIKLLPLGTRIATSTTALEDGNSWQPLSLTYHASLNSFLSRRQLYEDRLRRLGHRYAERERSIEQRQMHTMSALESHLTKLVDAQVDVSKLKRHLRDDCAGDRTWLNTILSGDVYEGHDAEAEANFDQVWKHTLHGEGAIYDNTPRGLLVDLNRRVEQQHTRLAEWRSFQKELSKRNEGLIASKSPFKSPTKTTPRSSGRSPLKSPRKTSKRTPSPRKGLINNSLLNDHPIASPSPPTYVSDDRVQTASRDLVGITAVDQSTLQFSNTSLIESRLLNKHSPPVKQLQSLHLGCDSESPSPIKRDLGQASNSMPPPPRPFHQRSQSAVTYSASVKKTSSRTPVVDEAERDKTSGSPVEYATPATRSQPSAVSSLTDRTRQSLSFKDTAAIHRRSSSVTTPPSSAIITPSKPPAAPNSDNSALSAEQHRQLTLAERTRQSMLQMSSKKPSEGLSNAASSDDRNPSATKTPLISRHASVKKTGRIGPQKPAFPVNPFDAEEPQRTEMTLEAKRRAPVNIGYESPANVIPEVQHLNGVIRGPSQISSIGDADNHATVGTLPDESEDYGGVFKTRSKMRRSPPPAADAIGHGPLET